MTAPLQRGINSFIQHIDAPIASFFNSCVHCGMCADACLFFTETQDPKYTPIYKLEPLRRIWKQEYTFWGKLTSVLGISKSVTDSELEEWETLIYDSCTLCGRCSLVCPVGNDITYMIRKAREGMVASRHAPKDLKEATERAIVKGSPMGVKLATLQAQIKHAEKETGLAVPMDVQGAELLVLLSSAEIVGFPEIIAAMSRIFNYTQTSWTFSSEAFEATNSGIQIGSSDLAAVILQRVVDAAEKLNVKTVIAPECGHAYTALRWEGPNLIGRPYKFNVLHIVELLDLYREQGRLKTEGMEEAKLTFHDPCQLVRRGGVIQQPRNLLKMVASNYMEMEDKAVWNWCCGGGGGVSANERAEPLQLTAFNKKKKQLNQLGVTTMVTACSNCRNVLHDGLDANQMQINVIGLTELISTYIPKDKSATAVGSPET